MVTLWDFYFAHIVGWSLHPGYKREGTDQLTLEECAEFVDLMLKEREKWQ